MQRESRSLRVRLVADPRGFTIQSEDSGNMGTAPDLKAMELGSTGLRKGMWKKSEKATKVYGQPCQKYPNVSQRGRRRECALPSKR